MSKATTEPKTIERGVIYRLNDFMARMGWGRHAMRSARRQGLRVVYAGNRCYVRGDDAVDFFERLAERSAG